MKRNATGEPVTTMHRWSSVPMSCRACRSKKRRCDRHQPCSNCHQRKLTCEYDDGATSVALPRAPSEDVPRQVVPSTSPNASEAILLRIAKLEEAVFNDPQAAHHHKSRATPTEAALRSDADAEHKPFRSHVLSSSREPSLNAAYLLRYLPPPEQARILFQHFAKTLHQNLMILHIPLARDLMEQVYATSEEPKDTDVANIFLLLCIFAGSALTWTPGLLETLHATQAEAKAAFQAYTHMAMAVVDHPTLLNSSTTSLVGMTMLTNIVLHAEGLTVKSHTIRARCLLMARDMQIHYLDSGFRRDQANLPSSNEIEKELQRRAWWNLVGSDWLSAFSDVYQEGVYIFHPQHMMINYPKNVDDVDLAATTEVEERPLSQATDLSAPIYRIKLADLCRQIADSMPWTGKEDEYATVLSLDQKFQDRLANLPTFFKLDPTSIRESQGICNQRPSLAVQRLGLNFSLHTRRCRLHRPYHLKGMVDSRYAYSRTTCVASAQKVLELRQSMEAAGPKAGFRPGRFWTFMQHVILATLVLATDISWDPTSPDAKTREEKVLAAYRMLERSKKESSSLVEGLQKNMQKIMAQLRRKDSSSETTIGNLGGIVADATLDPMIEAHLSAESNDLTVTNTEPIGDPLFSCSQVPPGGVGGESIYATPNDDWDPVWSEFLSLAPDFNGIQWDMLFNEMDLDI